MKIHIVSELSWLLKGNGVNTAFRQMVEMLRERNDIEVVVNHHGRGDLFHSHSYGLIYFLRGLPYKGQRVLTVHVIPDSARGSIPAWRLIKPLLNRYFRWVYSYADVCLAISPMVEQAILDLHAKTRIIRLANPVPVDFWKRTPELRCSGREMLSISEDEFVILGVGQIEGRKGVEDFIDIGKAMPGAKFIWAGGRPFGPLTEGLIRINNRIVSAPENVRFAGMFGLDQMPGIYAAADLFLFPSIQENCPMAPLEAAASGMPIIFRDLPEYTLLYENPYLKAADTPAFIALATRLMTDPELYASAKTMSAQLLTQFDKNVIIEKLVGLYRSLMNREP